MTHEHMGEQFGELVREVDPQPDVPRTEIWAGIAAARRLRQPVRRRPPVWVWGTSLAATLVVGFGLGRLWPNASGGAPVGLPAGSSQAELVSSPPPPVPPGAVDYLARTEALLASFPVDAGRGRAPEVAGWARQLLLDTRLMINSPIGGDAALVRLLQDLELVLAQIASLPAQNPQQEILLIEEGIRQNRVLARLRLAAGTAGVIGDD
jgi:hypothetical protein